MTCPHRTACCCKLGRFGGRPSLGVCATACDIGAKLEWPTLEGALNAPGGAPEPCADCGEGNAMPDRMKQ